MGGEILDENLNWNSHNNSHPHPYPHPYPYPYPYPHPHPYPYPWCYPYPRFSNAEPPRLIFGGAISWRGFCVTSLGGLNWRGLYMEGHIFGILRYYFSMMQMALFTLFYFILKSGQFVANQI